MRDSPKPAAQDRERPRITLGAVLMLVSMLCGLLVLAEGGSRLVALGVDRLRDIPLMTADAWSGVEWAADYASEVDAVSEMEWHSYVYWRRQPFAGRYINVDATGIRRTWRGDRRSGKRLRIFAMGGSAVWGMGARDDYTLPSHLARALVASGFDPEVTNLGESGWVTTQDLTMLQLRLQRGDVPDTVIFYGGYNDVFSTFQNGEAGLPFNERNRRLEFNAAQVEYPRRSFFVATAGLRRMSEALLKLVSGAVGQRVPAPQRNLAEQSRQLALHHCEIRRIASALSREYGFAVLFYLQPVLFTKRALSNSEERARNEWRDLEQLFQLAYPALLNAAGCQSLPIQDVSHTLDGESAPYFFDTVHITEDGNARVAAAMRDTLLKVLSSSRPN